MQGILTYLDYGHDQHKFGIFKSMGNSGKILARAGRMWPAAPEAPDMPEHASSGQLGPDGKHFPAEVSGGCNVATTNGSEGVGSMGMYGFSPMEVRRSIGVCGGELEGELCKQFGA